MSLSTAEWIAIAACGVAALAFVVALFLIAAITLHTWWAVAIGLVGSIGGALAVIVIVLKTVLADDGENG